MQNIAFSLRVSDAVLDEIWELYERLDTDGDGLLQKSDLPEDAPVLAGILKAMDADGNQSVDRDEYLKFFTRHMQAPDHSAAYGQHFAFEIPMLPGLFYKCVSCVKRVHAYSSLERVESDRGDVGMPADRVPLAEFIYGKKVIKDTGSFVPAAAALPMANPGMMSEEDHEYALHSLQTQVDTFIRRIVNDIRQKLEQHNHT
eukprot:SAG31_NODE_7968_length_1552_cov_1.866483_1_plen_201_part_00